MLTKLDRFLVLLDRWDHPDGQFLAARLRHATGKSGQARVLESALQMRHPWVRANAATILGLFGERGSVEPLLEALEDGESDVRIAAAKALGMIGDRRAGEGLVSALRDSEWQVRQEAVAALQALRDPDTATALAAAIGDPAWPVRVALAKCLGAIQGEEALPALSQLAQDEQADVRWAAVDQIPRLAPTAAVALAALGLKDRVNRVRQHAAAGLAQVKSQEAMQCLIGLVDDRDWSVRLTAVGEICRRADASHLPLLERLVRNSAEQIRATVCPALGRIGGREAILWLVAALEDDDRGVRVAACQALMRCAHDSRDPALRQALPALRRLDGRDRGVLLFSLPPRHNGCFREAMHFIEYVTREGGALPVTSCPAESGAEDLPIAAGPTAVASS